MNELLGRKRGSSAIMPILRKTGTKRSRVLAFVDSFVLFLWRLVNKRCLAFNTFVECAYAGQQAG